MTGQVAREATKTGGQDTVDRSGADAGAQDIAPYSSPAPGDRTRFGLALGGGAARGWAHIGVLNVLRREGLRPSVIAGSSIGAVVGGCYAAGKLDELESFARSLSARRVVGLLDFHINGSGLLAGDRLQKLMVDHLGTLAIEDLPLRFTAVATELGSGHEIWLSRGSLAEALRASYALPGVFDAVQQADGRWLTDGALVNPVPVNAVRFLGGETALAVNLNGQLRGRYAFARDEPAETADLADNADTSADSLLSRFFAPFQNAFPGARNAQRRRAPSIAAVMMDAFSITQDRITRSRLAGDPPDIMVAPRLAEIGLFDFHRAADAIALGEKAMERALPDLLDHLGRRER